MVRAIVVIASSALMIGLTVPNIWVPLGYALPLTVNAHYDVVSIVPGSSVEASGLRVGDHVEPHSLSPAGREALLGAYLLKRGESLPLTVDRSGRTLAVVIRQPEVVSHAFGLGFVKRTSSAIFIIVAAALLLLRPSTMLWGFFLYALGSVNGSPLILENVNTTLYVVVTAVLYRVVYSILGPVGLLVFATRFPVGSTSGWRRWVEKFTPLFAVLLALASVPRVFYIAGIPLSPAFDVAINAPSLVITIGIIALLVGFVHLDAPQRQRLRWVVAGFAIFYVGALYENLALYLPAQGWPPSWSNSGWSPDVLNGLVIFIPLTVAYAVLKHHVLDIKFVIGRGLVYGILTSIAIAIFAIIDWLVGSVLAQTRLAVAAEVVAAIGIGFWLNGLHGRVDRFVDAVIFRRRHLAEQRLGRIATGLPHADKYDVVAAMLVREPVEALGLSSGALFSRADNGDFRCDLSSGLPLPPGTKLDLGGELAIHLHGERGPIPLTHIGWRMSGVPGGQSMPVVALPIFVRHELRAIVFYGTHETGEAIDPDELRALESLCVGAGAALDHLDAADLRRRLDEMQLALTAAQKDLQSLRGTAPTGP